MSADRYAGSAGQAQLRQDEEKNSGAARTAAQEARRDLLFRLPFGRALDREDLVNMLDEGNQTARAIALRRGVLTEWRRQLPGGVLITPSEHEILLAWSEAHPTRAGACPGVREWPLEK